LFSPEVQVKGHLSDQLPRHIDETSTLQPVSKHSALSIRGNPVSFNSAIRIWGND
jgi:hypothetical protein